MSSGPAVPAAASGAVRVAIATPLERELVTLIAEVDPRLEIDYQPDLLPPVRYPGDHRGVDDFTRRGVQAQRWQEMLQHAEVLFGIPEDTPDGLAHAVRLNPGLRWVQATAAGAGEQARAAKLDEQELERVMITSASGVHATPLAEFCLFGLLAFTKDLPRLLDDQRERRWDHHPVAELRDRQLLIVGLGRIGEEVARLARAFGMHVSAISRTGAAHSPHVHEAHRPEALLELLPTADAVVFALPLTSETRGLVDAAAIAAMKEGAILVNVGRGGVIEEPALIAALREHRLSGAALDVFATEPLPAESPLWELSNVIISPHTAALSWRENRRIVELFAENLRRYLRGVDLVSRVDPALFY